MNNKELLVKSLPLIKVIHTALVWLFSGTANTLIVDDLSDLPGTPTPLLVLNVALVPLKLHHSTSADA